MGLLAVCAGLLTAERAAATGTWTALTRNAPSSVQLMLLLTDGTVMAADGGGNTWHRLTPDSHGSYVNGTWSTLASMHDTRLYFSSDVLRDGRVFVAGGEYGSGTNSAEVYDPLSNTWTMCPAAPTGQKLFYDSDSKILPNGNVLIAPVNPSTYGGTVIYDPIANAWITGPQLYRGYYQDEASWVKLPDDSILTIDPFGVNTERFIPSQNKWVNDANVPVQIYDSYGSEMGPGFLLPNGKAIFFGATGHTAIYTPSGNTAPGSWVAGPDFPNGQGMPDAAGAMLVNGKILCAVSTAPYSSSNIFNAPTSYYEYDPVANAYTQASAPGGGGTRPIPTYYTTMLDLPDGSVLYSEFGSHLYVYQPDGSPLPAGKPVITSVSTNLDGSLHLTGTLLNGISEGAAYGDDNQMNSNYPLIRLTDGAGNVYYCRTFNWSSTSVMTGSTPQSTDFSTPAGLPAGTYSLVVVANGISSDPVSFPPAGGALQITPAIGFTATGPVGGPFNVTSQNLVLTNAGTANLNWALANTASWLNVSASSGTLTPGGPAATVTISLNAAANALPVGTNLVALTFTNLSDHSSQSRLFTLQIWQPQPLLQNGGFETGDFTGWTFTGDPANSFVFNAAFNGVNPHSGTYAASLGEPGALGFLSQTVTTIPGQSYQISLWLNSPDGQTPNEFQVTWDGNVIYDQTDLPMFDWTNLVFVVTASGPNTTLQLGFQDDPSFLALDDVSLTRLAVPAFQSVTASGGTINFIWSAVAGSNYQLQYTTNLAAGAWLNLGGIMTPTNSLGTATDSLGPDRQRFYRVVQTP